MKLRTRTFGLIVGSLIFTAAVSSHVHGQAVTTAFTYQGVLRNSGAPLNGSVDLRFTLWDASVGGNQVGAAVPVNAIAVTDGLVSTTLDFGVNAFAGNQRWLQIEVDTTPAGGAGPFVALTPRQPLTAVPYALFSLAGSGQWTPNGANLNYTQGNVSVGTTNQSARMTIYPAAGGGGTQVGLYVRNTDTSQQTVSGQFVSDSPNGIGVIAQITSTSVGTGRAMSAHTSAAGGAALYANAASATGSAIAVQGISNSSSGWAGYFDGRGHFAEWTGVGRTTSIGSEIFGIRHPTTSGYGGMYVDTAGAAGWPFYGYATGGSARMWTYYDGATDKWHLYNSGTRMTVDGAGNVGIANADPEVKLHILGGSDTSPTGGGFIVTGSTTSTNISMDNNEIMARNNGAASTLHLNADGGDVQINQSGSGRLITRVLQIVGGADLSEGFAVSDEHLAPEPGMVVVIDPDNPGALVAASTAYDKKVAGVISGAGGVATGMMMGQEGTIADGDHPVALTGRVYCLVDASNAAVEPGDLLTTSDTPGHAMKAEDSTRSHGAIIGKAMTALPRGEKGLVLVLVNLQ